MPAAFAVALYWRQMASVAAAAELVLYLAGALLFLRNGGHDRCAVHAVQHSKHSMCLSRWSHRASMLLAITPPGHSLACPALLHSCAVLVEKAYTLCLFFLLPGRWTGLTDHHFLHYFVTTAAALHIWLLLSTGALEEAAAAGAAEARVGAQQP